MKKIIHPIDINDGYRKNFYPVFFEIEFNDGRLSIHGVEGPTQSGNAKGSCGQILDHYRTHTDNYGQTILTKEKVIYKSSNGGGYETLIRFTKGWNYANFKEFLDVWKRWHLNDLNAGTPMQEEHLRRIKELLPFPGYPVSYYEWASNILYDAGLNPSPDKEGYLYGHAWLKEEVPQEAIEWLFNLPDTDKTPAWV